MTTSRIIMLTGIAMAREKREPKTRLIRVKPIGETVYEFSLEVS